MIVKAVKRGWVYKAVILMTLCFTLLLFGQNPFPFLEAKIKAGRGGTTSVVVKETNYRTYLFLSEVQLFQTTFKRELFWHNDVNYSLTRNKPITIDYFAMDGDEYSIVYGCCNDEKITSVELEKQNGENVPLELSAGGIFYIKMQWSDIREVCAYDASGNLIYRQKLNGIVE